MAKIRNLEFYDIKNLKKMISFLTTDTKSHLKIKAMPFIFNKLHDLLPINLKFLTESYVAIKDKQINGMISLHAKKKNPKTWKITKLVLNKNSYETGVQLVDFVVAKYGAKGVTNFKVSVDESHDEVLNLFSKNCGFRACASEQLWKISEINFLDLKYNECNFRPFKNSDSQKVTEIFNDAIVPHFRYSLAKIPDEFCNPFFGGLSKNYTIKYLVCDKTNEKIFGYILIKTEDNSNFLIDAVLSQPYVDYYETVINFAIKQISNRKNDFFVFVKNRKYQINAQKYEQFLNKNNFKQIQNHIILIKDFFKTIKTEEIIAKPAILYSDINTKPAFKI